MNILATILSGLSLLLSILFPIQLKKINSIYFAKLAAGAFSPVWAIWFIIQAIVVNGATSKASGV